MQDPVCSKYPLSVTMRHGIFVGNRKEVRDEKKKEGSGRDTLTQMVNKTKAGERKTDGS